MFVAAGTRRMASPQVATTVTPSPVRYSPSILTARQPLRGSVVHTFVPYARFRCGVPPHRLQILMRACPATQCHGPYAAGAHPRRRLARRLWLLVLNSASIRYEMCGAVPAGLVDAPLRLTTAWAGRKRQNGAGMKSLGVGTVRVTDDGVMWTAATGDTAGTTSAKGGKHPRGAATGLRDVTNAPTQGTAATKAGKPAAAEKLTLMFPFKHVDASRVKPVRAGSSPTSGAVGVFLPVSRDGSAATFKFTKGMPPRVQCVRCVVCSPVPVCS